MLTSDHSWRINVLDLLACERMSYRQTYPILDLKTRVKLRIPGAEVAQAEH